MIAATTPSPLPTEPAQVTPESPRDGVDVAPDAPGKVAFGRRLQQAIDGDAKDAKDATVAVADAGRKTAVPTEIVCFAPPTAVDDGRDAKDDPNTTDAGADLAAQLALVSHWTGLAQAPATPVAPGAGTAAIDATATTATDASGLARKPAAAGRSTGAVGTSPAARDDPAARAVQAENHDTTAKADASARDADRVSTVALATPVLATTLLASGALKNVVERTIAPLDATPGPSSASLAATLLHAAAATAVGDANGATAPSALREPVGTSAWTEEFGRAAVHVAASSLKEASLRLNPEHLGPLDVRVRIDDGVAHLAFQAAHVDTRHALEASRAMLDQLFANQGLSIGNYTVDDHAASGNASRDTATTSDTSAGGGGGDRRPFAGAATADDDALQRVVSARLAKPLGLVDTFA